MADTLSAGFGYVRSAKYERDNATQAYLQRKNEGDNMVTLRSMVTNAGHGNDNVSLSVE